VEAEAREILQQNPRDSLRRMMQVRWAVDETVVAPVIEDLVTASVERVAMREISYT
jgi:hypothetical protein